MLPPLHPILTGGIVLGLFGVSYLSFAGLLGAGLPGLRRR